MVVVLALNPYVDLCVWTPRMERVIKEVHTKGWIPDGIGGVKKAELLGPATFLEWMERWRVFEVAMLMSLYQ